MIFSIKRGKELLRHDELECQLGIIRLTLGESQAMLPSCFPAARFLRGLGKHSPTIDL